MPFYSMTCGACLVPEQSIQSHLWHTLSGFLTKLAHMQKVNDRRCLRSDYLRTRTARARTWPAHWFRLFPAACAATSALPRPERETRVFKDRFPETSKSAQGRERRNATGIEKPIHGPVPEDKPSLRCARTGVHHIAPSGRVLTTLPEIGAIGQLRSVAARRLADSNAA